MYPRLQRVADYPLFRYASAVHLHTYRYLYKGRSILALLKTEGSIKKLN